MERTNISLIGLLSLVAAVPASSQPAQSLSPGYLGSPTRSTSENLSIKRYVTAGDRAYEVGTLDGTFPQIGWHVKGHMNGVWAPPIKLLDSYRFLIDGQPLPSANKFTSGAGYVEFEYPETNSLQITRTVFAPDGIPAVLVGLNLRNASNRTQSFRLLLEATSELIAAYPWSRTTPTSDQVHQPDRVSFEPMCCGLLFSAPDRPFCALVNGLPHVSNGRDSADFVLASLPDSAPQTQAGGWAVDLAGYRHSRKRTKALVHGGGFAHRSSSSLSGRRGRTATTRSVAAPQGRRPTGAFGQQPSRYFKRHASGGL